MGAASPSSASELLDLTTPEVLDAAAAHLDPRSVDVLAYASASSGYVLGPEAEEALVSRLGERWSVPAVSTSLSAVAALRGSAVQRLSLVHPPVVR